MVVERSIVQREIHAYSSHPCALGLQNGEWLIAYLETMRRDRVFHSPGDPRYYAMLLRSADQGRSWSQPVVIPGYDWYGVECPGIVQLGSGRLLLFQWRWRWAPHPPGSPPVTRSLYEPDEVPWTRGNDGAYVHWSDDNGRTWHLGDRIDTTPYSGAYMMRPAVELPGGDILFPVTDIPNWRRIYLLRSGNGGRSWSVGSLIASDIDHQYSEPCILRCGDRLIVLIREVQTGHIFQSDSFDNGHTWSAPRQTPMWGNPPHLLDLGDGRVLCTYGHRREPFGIRACVSGDQGRTWNVDQEIVLVDDLPNANLGYPSSLLIEPGRVFTAYYGEDDVGTTCIQGIEWKV